MGLSIYRTTIYQATVRLFSGLLPQDCHLCGRFSGDALLCAACTADLPRLPAALCPVCASPVALDGRVCGACLARPPHFEATRVAHPYAFPVDHLVQGLKYRHHLPLAKWLAAVLLDHVDASGVDCLMPLPLSPERMRERGFNQAQEIARALARRLGMPLVSDACLRVRDAAAQAGLPWKARQANIRQAFECRADLAGKRIAVVDDVMTSGATLNEFARVLKLHGALRVENWVAARTLPP